MVAGVKDAGEVFDRRVVMMIRCLGVQIGEAPPLIVSHSGSLRGSVRRSTVGSRGAADDVRGHGARRPEVDGAVAQSMRYARTHLRPAPPAAAPGSPGLYPPSCSSATAEAVAGVDQLTTIAGTARHAELIADCLGRLEMVRVSRQVDVIDYIWATVG